MNIYKKFVKRALDIVLSLMALVLFWWLFVILAVIVRIKMGSPILYTAERMGKDEKPFSMYKFRSMTNAKDENGVLLPASQRLTKFGRLLRSTSLDELPSLINIIKGDMSIVGPRPLLMKYKPYYYEHERARHSMRPGLTGWAQVHGRNAIAWEKRFDLDIYYVNNASLILDIKTLFLTVYKVFKRADIVQDKIETTSLHILRADMVTENHNAAELHEEVLK